MLVSNYIQVLMLIDDALTYWEDNRDTTAYGLCSSQICLLAQPQVLCLSALALPARHGSSKQQHLNALTGGQRGNDLLASSLSDNVNLSSGSRGSGRVQRRGAVRAVDHGGGCVVDALMLGLRGARGDGGVVGELQAARSQLMCCLLDPSRVRVRPQIYTGMQTHLDRRAGGNWSEE